MGQSQSLLCLTGDGKAQQIMCLSSCRDGSSGAVVAKPITPVNKFGTSGNDQDIGQATVEEVIVPSYPRQGAGGGLCITYPICCAEDGSGRVRALTDEELQTARGAAVRKLIQRRRHLRTHYVRRFDDYYDLGQKLGEGSFGNVYQVTGKHVDPITGQPDLGLEVASGDMAAGGYSGRSTRSTLQPPRPVAAKIFDLVTTPSDPSTSPRQRSDDIKRRVSYEGERELLSELSHPHICRMYECFSDPGRLYIILELCQGGELYTRLVSRAKSGGGSLGIEEPLAAYFFRQMLHAVGYLHCKRIVHRDLKTENFLLLGAEGTLEADVLKLCDFGTSTQLTLEKPRSMENIGTLSYTAPEVYANKGAAVSADTWSLGVVLYVLVTGANPFRPRGQTSREETVKRIQKGQFEQRRPSWMSVSNQAKDLVRQLLVLDEEKRLSCKEALTTDWMRNSTRGVVTLEKAGDGTLSGQAPHLLALVIRLPAIREAQRLALTACSLASPDPETRPNGVLWRELFLTLDDDLDGCLSFQEFVQGLKLLLGPAVADVTEQQLLAFAMALDFDRSGMIEWAEWLTMALLASTNLSNSAGILSVAHRMVDRPMTEGLGMAIAKGESFPDDNAAVTPGEIIGGAVDPRLRKATPAEGPGAYLLLSDLRYVVESAEVFEVV